MLFDNSYNQLKKPSTGIYKEKGSKFISYAFIVKDKNEINYYLNQVKKKEHGARHFCYAYILNPDKSVIKVNDDGEPSSTAGRPILGQINSNNLTNTLIIVVRYFGGIKLGISGLIRSYKNAAYNSIKNNKIISLEIKEIYTVKYNYNDIDFIMKNIKKYDAKIISQENNINSEITYSISINKADILKKIFLDNHKINVEFIKIIK
ncbi:MAG: YigZ family protein [Flavobacteriales bacterium]|jgi:uncharacterized YigZ family protein|nr:YigZ family protein [Flavobacteriales bacterium]|tara:strand:+ start:1226 stop:1843 length:618 start_codon:yes stop_codon:yes gene_type:complete